MGAVKALKALAAIPPDQRSPEVERTIAQGAEFMLRHHIHKRSHDLAKDSKPGWLRLGFPLMYQTDILEILGILTTLGYRNERMQEALRLVAGKADAQGRWKLGSTFNDRFLVPIEAKGEPSRWVTPRGAAGAEVSMRRSGSGPSELCGRLFGAALGQMIRDRLWHWPTGTRGGCADLEET